LAGVPEGVPTVPIATPHGPERPGPAPRVGPFGTLWRGMAMGLADVVPGVSGGTMALLLGVYPRLIAALAALTSAATWRALVDRRWAAAWRAVDGTFLATLVLGIGLSVVAAAGLVEAALDAYRPWVYAAFFGLVAASGVVVVRLVRTRGPVQVAAFFGTAIAAALLVGLAPTTTPDAAWFLALAGAIGICALVLPGISGAFLLVLLGQYERVIGAIASADLATLVPFALGAGIGLLGFARLLARWLRHAPDTTHAVLAGFLFGSLRRVWPWQGDEALRLTLLAPPDPLAATAAAALALGAFAAVLALAAWERRAR
jgi:putative membrane protein